MIDLSVAEIARRLADHVEALCKELLPNGRRDGSEWRCGSINGEAGGSLGVHLVGEKAGRWSDFASPGGNGGDLLDLIQQTKHLDKAGAVAWAKGMRYICIGVVLEPCRRSTWNIFLRNVLFLCIFFWWQRSIWNII